MHSNATNILGIWDGHNAGACLLQNGIITACISEERISRIKNDAGYPKRSVEKILEITNTKSNTMDLVALGSRLAHKRDFYFSGWDWYKVSYNDQKNLPSKDEKIKSLENRNKERKNDIIQHLGIPENKISIVDHHLAHASTAYYGGPWKNDEKVLVLTCDGGGDGICATVNIGEAGKLTRISETPSSASIGKIYSRITLLLGMKPWEHEYKVMGLAPYADEKGVLKSFQVIEKLLEVPSDSLEFKLKSELSTHYCYPYLKENLENHRFDWIAGAVQKLTENLLISWVKNAIKKTGIKRIACAGGVFMNVKANMKILELPEVEDIFIFPSSGDESIAIGAAYNAYYESINNINSTLSINPLGPIYFGQDFSKIEIEKSLTDFGIKNNPNYIIEYYDDINSIIAKLLVDGKIVARFTGRMEWGARALGNRSILSNPSSSDFVREINLAIKQRDFWMPFAPTILSDKQSILIENPKNVKSHYMTLTFNTKKAETEKIIAAIHPYDFTTRAQLLEREFNPDYYDLIEKFYKITGIPAILNTSFNLHGEPIVSSPTDALQTLVRSGLRFLALGNYFIKKVS